MTILDPMLNFLEATCLDYFPRQICYKNGFICTYNYGRIQKFLHFHIYCILNSYNIYLHCFKIVTF